ncbi:MAG: adenosylmethionine-8-amino-7-oxononanoate aminotransferase [Chlorobi bacterium]|nr:adenosylmethionine-8-amino-7-oxononanoate aminotransferase [Chlorobiota bacterium]
MMDETSIGGAPGGWVEMDRRHVWHPYTQMLAAPAPVPIARGEGAYLITGDGRRILDAISSWWVTLHGHCHPHIVSAIARQAAELEQVIFAGFTHQPAARLASELAGILPGDIDRVFYSDDGSTAVEIALKMCIGLWANRGERRGRFLALEDAYHGDTFGAMAVSERSVFTRQFSALLFDVTRLPFPADGEPEERFLTAAADELRKGDVAGVIVEPLILGAGGMRPWSPGALARLAALCRANGVPLIADEVMTGFGRTGTMFAVERAEIVPDIICLSKGLSGGFLPFAVTACRPWIYEAFLSDDRSRALFHGHSFTANPLGCAAALASLELFRTEPVMERIASIEAVHRERMAALAASGAVADARVLGTIAAFNLRSDTTGYLSNAAARIVRRGFERGFLLRPLGDVVYIMPPYCTSSHDLHRLHDFLADELSD